MKSFQSSVWENRICLYGDKKMPEINFVYDNSIEYGIEMSKKIDEVLGDSLSESDSQE
mgnify:CR=1 FL=1